MQDRRSEPILSFKAKSGRVSRTREAGDEPFGHGLVSVLRLLWRALPRSRPNAPLRVNEFFAIGLPTRLLAAEPWVFGDIMDKTVEKSCWGVTVRAVAGFGGVLVLAYLFGGF